jgi:aspartyl protease family protein
VNNTQFKALWIALGLVGAVPTVQLLMTEIQRLQAQQNQPARVAEPARPPAAQVARPGEPPRIERTKGAIGLRLRADDRGHFVTKAVINRVHIPVLVDTGASAVAMSYETAQIIGLRLKPGDFTVPVQTANGIAKAAPVKLAELRLGDITVENVEGWVMPRGALKMDTLLGMSFLKRLSKVEMSNGVLVLKQ